MKTNRLGMPDEVAVNCASGPRCWMPMEFDFSFRCEADRNRRNLPEERVLRSFQPLKSVQQTASKAAFI